MSLLRRSDAFGNKALYTVLWYFQCERQLGDSYLNPNNIIESRKFEVTTPEVKISVSPENSYLIETRVINGRKYILIPADDQVEINGMPVTVS